MRNGLLVSYPPSQPASQDFAFIEKSAAPLLEKRLRCMVELRKHCKHAPAL
jgi:hypothetical protein